MPSTINPASLLDDITTHRQLAKGIVDSDRIIIAVGEKVSIMTTSQSGLITTSGKPDVSESFIVASKLITNILSALKGESEVLLTMKDESIELQGTKTYEIPVIWTTEEMVAEFYKEELDSQSSLISIENELASAAEQAVSSISRIGANAPTKTIIAKQDGRTWIAAGQVSAICVVSAPTLDKDTMIVDSKDPVLLQMITKLPMIPEAATIRYNKSLFRLSGNDIVMSHTAKVNHDDNVLNRILALVTGKDPSSALTFNSSEMLGIVKDAMAIATKKDSIPVKFTADGIEVKLTSGVMRYEFSGPVADYLLEGEDVTLPLPANMIFHMLQSLSLVTLNGTVTMRIFTTGRDKAILIGGEFAGEGRMQYILKVTAVNL